MPDGERVSSIGIDRLSDSIAELSQQLEVSFQDRNVPLGAR